MMPSRFLVLVDDDLDLEDIKCFISQQTELQLDHDESSRKILTKKRKIDSKLTCIDYLPTNTRKKSCKLQRNAVSTESPLPRINDEYVIADTTSNCPTSMFTSHYTADGETKDTNASTRFRDKMINKIEHVDFDLINKKTEICNVKKCSRKMERLQRRKFKEKLKNKLLFKSTRDCNGDIQQTDLHVETMVTKTKLPSNSDNKEKKVSTDTVDHNRCATTGCIKKSVRVWKDLQNLCLPVKSLSNMESTRDFDQLDSDAETVNKLNCEKSLNGDIFYEEVDTRQSVHFRTEYNCSFPKLMTDNCSNLLSDNRLCQQSEIHNSRSPNCVDEQMCIALDCEFVGVGLKKISALGRCSIVDYHGKVIYDEYCRPELPITDYRTKWSGIRRKHMKRALPFDIVQNRIKSVIQDKVVVGHALFNDFRVLGLQHPSCKIRDTSTYKQLRKMGRLPARNQVSLKNLSKALLGSNIQSREHCSVEDARAAMSIYKLVQTSWEQEILSSLKHTNDIQTSCDQSLNNQKQGDKIQQSALNELNNSFLDDQFWPQHIFNCNNN